MTDFLNANRDAVISLVVALIGLGWTFFKSTDVYRKFIAWLQAKRLEKAWAIALEIVQDIYESEVRVLKQSGKFDAELKRKLKANAVESLRAAISTRGIPLAKEYLPTLIELAVNYLKNKAKGNSEAIDPLPFAPAPSPDLE